MLQARFDRACSWEVLESSSYRPRPGLSRIGNGDILNLETSADVFIMEPLMWQCRAAIPWKAAYGPQIKQCVCSKRVKKWAELNTMEFWKGIKGYEACISDKLPKDKFKKQATYSKPMIYTYHGLWHWIILSVNLYNNHVFGRPWK
jgi:hypothetical protein